MALRRRPEAAAFWLQWVLASAIGAAVPTAPAFALAVASDIDHTNIEEGVVVWVVILIVTLFLANIGVAIAQWLVLRRFLSEAGAWLWATCGGIPTAFFIVWLPALSVCSSLNQSLRVTTALTICGSAVGALQWLALHGQVPGGGRWILASSAGWAAGAVTFLSLVGQTDWNSSQGLMLSGIAAWAAYGAVTGGMLARLLIRSWDSWR
jgi:hypothetical protein